MLGNGLFGVWGLWWGRGSLRKIGPEAGLWTPECEDPRPGASWADLAYGHFLSCDILVCSCALQRDLLLQGRLYISPNWLCFHASLFGRDIKVVMSGKGCHDPVRGEPASCLKVMPISLHAGPRVEPLAGWMSSFEASHPVSSKVLPLLKQGPQCGPHIWPELA